MISGKYKQRIWLFVLFTLGATVAFNSFEMPSDPHMKQKSKVRNDQINLNDAHKKKVAVFETVFGEPMVILGEALRQRGFEIGNEDQNRKSWILDRFDFKWTWDSAAPASLPPTSTGILNQFKGVGNLTDKDGLVASLRKNQNSKDWFPRSFIISCNDAEPDEMEEFRTIFNQAEILKLTKKQQDSQPQDQTLFEDCSQNFHDTSRDPILGQSNNSYGGLGTNNLWIAKVANLAGGVGARVFHTLEELDQHLEKNCDANRNFVIQKYNERPLLIQGLKWDLRVWVLVLSLDPYIALVNDDCYVRFALKPFDNENTADETIHLTNHEVLRQYTDVSKLDIPFAQWSLGQLKEWLAKEGHGDNIWENHILPKVLDIAKESVRAWDSANHRDNSFQLLGFDIMLDDQLDVYLIEINHNPSTHLRTDIVKNHHPEALRSMLDIVLNFWGLYPRKVEEILDKSVESLESFALSTLDEIELGKWRVAVNDGKTVRGWNEKATAIQSAKNEWITNQLSNLREGLRKKKEQI